MSVTVDHVMVEARAASFTTRSIKTTLKRGALHLALSMVDLTTLEGMDSPGKVRALCAKAKRPMEGVPHVAAVCVYPALVPVAADALKDTDIRIASVATGFPSGQYPLDVRRRDTELAIADGADEIDMVINRGAFHAGRLDVVHDEIREIATCCLERGAHLKVILETGELGHYDNVRRASDLAIGALHESGLSAEPGGAFIKTSTGKVSPAATMPVTLVMLEAIRDHHHRTGEFIGMKPAGGIRTAKQALHYLAMLHETLGVVDPRWLHPSLFRFGASSLVNDLLRQIARQDSGVYMADEDFSQG